ncbi:TauD/TfdA family dioxygenase [Pseudorhodoferax sp. Leaf274]|uniref:TauD/TfdA dioxygenase family protein n=1 Tax=Pseudorhodoferax sp. Leaf274 TaxID=1736318 RepID=UPI000702722F|nr:TauD/TfdA family dioxygenase [Pseudorhodoferax sp. Leaf274]KQP43163.1 taurine dioxygenase [Pseudorhodoferax sp. Leaf274]
MSAVLDLAPLLRAAVPPWQVAPIAGAALGAVAQGIDARQPLHAAQVRAIRHALQRHRIVLLRGQQLDDAQYLRLASYFGSVFQPPADVPVLASDPYGGGNLPAIVKVGNVEDGVLGHHELAAHSDHHWTPQPSSGSFLYALQVPSVGGETTWVDEVAAYEALDGATRATIDGLQLITYNPFLRRLHPLPSGERPLYRTPDIAPLAPFEVHPLVRTHPDTGQRLLYLDAATEVEIVGLGAAEGRALIERLRAHLAQPRFAYTHRWQVGDIVYWDNQATLHARTGFAPDEQRLLKRISLSGSRPF